MRRSGGVSDRGVRPLLVDHHRLLLLARRALRRRHQRPGWRELQTVRRRRQPTRQHRLERRSVGEVHPVDLAQGSRVLGDPPDLRPVRAERERRERRVGTREDEPDRVLALVAREPDALALCLVHDEAEREPARVVRDRSVRALRQIRQLLDAAGIHEPLLGCAARRCVDTSARPSGRRRCRDPRASRGRLGVRTRTPRVAGRGTDTRDRRSEGRAPMRVPRQRTRPFRSEPPFQRTVTATRFHRQAWRRPAKAEPYPTSAAESRRSGKRSSWSSTCTSRRPAPPRRSRGRGEPA